MHMGVDHAREDVQPACINLRPGTPLHLRRNRHDPPLGNGQIAALHTSLGDERPIADDEIVARHSGSFDGPHPAAAAAPLSHAGRGEGLCAVAKAELSVEATQASLTPPTIERTHPSPND